MRELYFAPSKNNFAGEVFHESKCISVPVGSGLRFRLRLTFGQDETTYIFGTYYYCDQNREAWSDKVTEAYFAPLIEAQIKEGRLNGWGRMAHNVGGKWRRVEYMGSSDLNVLLDARDALIESLQTAAADAGRELGEICPDHDDYIWQSVATSRPLSEDLADRAKAAYSTYFECDVSRQERADEIFKQAYVPAMNQLVQQGKLQSWGYFAHVVGGKYRRLLTHSGADHKTLIEAVDTYSTMIDEKNKALGDEFSAICNLHDDYLWDVVISRP